MEKYEKLNKRKGSSLIDHSYFGYNKSNDK